MERTALYAGSFNPFTRGHQNVVDRALALFDRVVVAVGFNIDKPQASTDAVSRAEVIARLYANEPRVSVRAYSGLTARFAAEIGATALVRGVRGAADIEAEINLATVNRGLTGIETVLLPALPSLAHVSASVVRELEHYGADTTDYLPTCK